MPSHEENTIIIIALLDLQDGASTCFLIFLPTLVMGNFMVLNLFLALLLNSFNSEELKNRKEVSNSITILLQAKFEEKILKYFVHILL